MYSVVQNHKRIIGTWKVSKIVPNKCVTPSSEIGSLYRSNILSECQKNESVITRTKEASEDLGNDVATTF